ncbi:hypothetical protein R1flu_012589 [Riccia fluitans]|uniref:Uncharacterized protein n=1 Tax=Riccia fluitans TaxID=41844 RepID=A0ABD1ZF59_9MARC
MQLNFCLILTQKSQEGSESSNGEQGVDAEELLEDGLSLYKSLRPIAGLKTRSSADLVTRVAGFSGFVKVRNVLTHPIMTSTFCAGRSRECVCFRVWRFEYFGIFRNSPFIRACNRLASLVGVLPVLHVRTQRPARVPRVGSFKVSPPLLFYARAKVPFANWMLLLV